jgi:predicted deacetylase
VKVGIDIDDYHSFPRWDCSDVLEQLVSEFPDIKFTLFVTPYMKKIPLTDYPQALDAINRLIASGHVEVFPHGLTHTKLLNGEFGGLPKRAARKRIAQSFTFLEKAGIPTEGGYKFPWDLYNRAALSVIEENNYILFSHKKADFPGRTVIWADKKNTTKRYIQTADYYYGKPQHPGRKDTVYYHGHAQNMRHNGIRESCNHLIAELKELGAPDEVDFIFCSVLAES